MKSFSDFSLSIPIPVNKSSLTTIDIFQLKILVKCWRINVNWYTLACLKESFDDDYSCCSSYL